MKTKSSKATSKSTPVFLDIKESTVGLIEDFAYHAYTEAQALAFKLDGMLGVAQFALVAHKAIEEQAAELKAQGATEEQTSALVWQFVGTEWAPGMVANMTKVAETREAVAA